MPDYQPSPAVLAALARVAAHPPHGEVWASRHADGTVTVDHADDRILVTDEVAAYARREDGTLVLDTAGQYRYRFADDQTDRPPGAHFYERISPAGEPTTMLSDLPTPFAAAVLSSVAAGPGLTATELERAAVGVTYPAENLARYDLGDRIVWRGYGNWLTVECITNDRGLVLDVRLTASPDELGLELVDPAGNVVASRTIDRRAVEL